MQTVVLLNKQDLRLPSQLQTLVTHLQHREMRPLRPRFASTLGSVEMRTSFAKAGLRLLIRIVRLEPLTGLNHSGKLSKTRCRRQISFQCTSRFFNMESRENLCKKFLTLIACVDGIIFRGLQNVSSWARPWPQCKGNWRSSSWLKRRRLF